jgi:hypothetical protein
MQIITLRVGYILAGIGILILLSNHWPLSVSDIFAIIALLCVDSKISATFKERKQP